MRSSNLWRVLAAAALAITSGLLAAGCGTDTTELTAIDTASAVDEFFASRNAGTAEQVVELNREVTLCMRQLGFDYEPPPDQATPADNPNYWVHPDKDRAASFGYGIADSFRTMNAEAIEDEATSNLDAAPAEHPAEYSAALFGEGWDTDEGASGGCIAEAEQHLRDSRQGPLIDPFQFADRLASSSLLTDIEDSWMACMRSQGYPLTDADPVGFTRSEASDTSTASGLERLAEFERKVAEADVACILPHHDALMAELQSLAASAHP